MVGYEKQPKWEMREARGTLGKHSSWFPLTYLSTVVSYYRLFPKQWKIKKKNWNHIRSHSFSSLLSLSLYIASLWSSLSKNSRLIQQMHRSTFNERLQKNFWRIGNEPVLINSSGSNFGNFSDGVRQPLLISGAWHPCNRSSKFPTTQILNQNNLVSSVRGAG